MEDLRKGKADVLESGHSLILGWSDKILPIVDQLCNANASEGGRPIVILAEMEKQAMEEGLAKHAPNLRGSTVVCRSATSNVISVCLEGVLLQVYLIRDPDCLLTLPISI